MSGIVEKKRHTYKEILITNKARWIFYISKVYKGKAHDFSIVKKEFKPGGRWFEEYTVRLDLGFQGFKEAYRCAQVHIPHKRKRAKKGVDNSLTEDQKQYNAELGQERIFVEHSIGGMKRYRILVNRNRIKDFNLVNEIVGVCAGLWNFHLKCSESV